MSFMNKDSFIYLSPISMPLPSFSCLISLAKTCRKSRNNERGQSYFDLDLGGESIHFFTLSIILAVNFFFVDVL